LIQIKNGLIEEIRQGFKTNRHLADKGTISASIKDAQKNLEAIKSLSNRNAYDSDSWINNSDDDNDQKGRIGFGWPWETDKRI